MEGWKKEFSGGYTYEELGRGGEDRKELSREDLIKKTEEIKRRGREKPEGSAREYSTGTARETYSYSLLERKTERSARAEYPQGGRKLEAKKGVWGVIRREKANGERKGKRSNVPDCGGVTRASRKKEMTRGSKRVTKANFGGTPSQGGIKKGGGD